MAKVRTHVMLSKELLEQVDRVAGKRRRSEFIEEAIEDRLKNARLLDAVSNLDTERNPISVEGWDDPEEWVDTLRSVDREDIPDPVK